MCHHQKIMQAVWSNSELVVLPCCNIKFSRSLRSKYWISWCWVYFSPTCVQLSFFPFVYIFPSTIMTAVDGGILTRWTPYLIIWDSSKKCVCVEAWWCLIKWLWCCGAITFAIWGRGRTENKLSPFSVHYWQQCVAHEYENQHSTWCVANASHDWNAIPSPMFLSYMESEGSKNKD